MRKESVLIGLLLLSVHINPCIGGDVEDDPENIEMKKRNYQEAQEECNKYLQGIWSQVRDMFCKKEVPGYREKGKRVTSGIDNKKMR